VAKVLVCLMSFSEDNIMDFHVCRPLHALHKDALFYVKSKFKSLQTVPVTFDNRPLRITESFNVLMKIMDYRMAVPYPNAPYLGMAMANALHDNKRKEIIANGIALKLLCLDPSSLLNMDTIRAEMGDDEKVRAFGEEVLVELRKRTSQMSADLKAFRKMRETYIDDLDRFGRPNSDTYSRVLLGPYILHLCGETFSRLEASLEAELNDKANLKVIANTFQETIYDPLHRELVDIEVRNEERRGLKRKMDPMERLNGLMTIAILADKTCPFIEYRAGGGGRDGRDNKTMTELAGALILGLLTGSV